ncbi:MAG TPA: hypothetical protein VH744_09020 [Terriglobales bacterium]|jgi:CHASE3 domain sensor protein
MADNEIVRLLQEIRDLQKEHIENYKAALQNQQRSIEIQQQAVRRQKSSLVVAGILIVVVLILLPVLGWVVSWGARCALTR